MAFRRVLARTELWPGEMVSLLIDDVPVLLVNIDDVVHAYEDRCAHQRARLSEGILDGCVLTCTAHGWSYDASSGNGLNPDMVKLRRFAVRLCDNDILVDVGEAP